MTLEVNRRSHSCTRILSEQFRWDLLFPRLLQIEVEQEWNNIAPGGPSFNASQRVGFWVDS